MARRIQAQKNRAPSVTLLGVTPATRPTYSPWCSIQHAREPWLSGLPCPTPQADKSRRLSVPRSPWVWLSGPSSPRETAQHEGFYKDTLCYCQEERNTS